MPGDAPQPAPVGRIAAEEVARRLRAGQALLLVCAYDSPVAWGKLGLVGALPLGQLAERLEPGAEVVLYCRCPSDRTAERAARDLRARGLATPLVLEGGYEAALAAGLRPLRRR